MEKFMVMPQEMPTLVKGKHCRAAITPTMLYENKCCAYEVSNIKRQMLGKMCDHKR